jgi:murein DD-endopeptidase MepM/ murein hydrolase activator NlpD
MAVQLRSFIETFRGIIACIVAVLTFGASLTLIAGSGAIDLTGTPTAEASPLRGVEAEARELALSAEKEVRTAIKADLGGLRGDDNEAEANTGDANFREPLIGIVQTPAQARLQPRVDQRNLKVRRGDTLEKILERAGAERGQAYYATKSLARVHNARSLNVGQEVAVTLEYPVEPSTIVPGLDIHADKPILKRLTIETDVDARVSVSLRDDGSYHPEKLITDLAAGFDLKGGTITSSLYVAALDAGIPDAVIIDLISLYSYDIDFQREIRKGDAFELLFERFYDEEGRAVKSGRIDYASMTVQRRQKGYYRFKTTDDGITDYYDAKGQSAKKFLMRTPINGARISSSFGRRKHPVLGYTKQHAGTDFAAPTGTPIFAAGNGVIERSSRYGSYGNYVRIRHANGYKTAYAHMSRYGKGIKQGRRVKQGQIIGYVGATGRVTGAHLHYEVMINGKKVNPLRIKVPTGRKLGGNMLAAFRIERDRIDAERAAQATKRGDQMIAGAGEDRRDG